MGKLGRPHVIIAAVQVPFTRGGAEVLVDGLRRELAARDFEVDVVQVPFSAQPKEAILNQLAIWRSLDLRTFNGKKVDLVIGTKFPSYVISHPNKTVWLVHQHRQIYDLYGSRFGELSTAPADEALRRMVVGADLASLRECKGVYTISENVKQRLKRYLDVDAEALPPPLPLGTAYEHGTKGDYILSVGRICSIKRVDLIVKALPQIHNTLKLKIVGVPDEPAIDTYLKSEIDKHHLWHRIEFLGRVSNEELIKLYAGAFAVYYAPFDEDYGFVTLEGLSSGKPIITCTDSGGVLEFVRDEDNGLIVEPVEAAVARAANRMLEDEVLYAQLVAGARRSEFSMNWDEVINSLTSSLWQQDSKVFAAA